MRSLREYMINAQAYARIGLVLLVASLTGGCLEQLVRSQAVNAKTAKQATLINLAADAVGGEENYQKQMNVAGAGATNVYVNGGNPNYNEGNGQLTPEEGKELVRRLQERDAREAAQKAQ